MDSRAVAGCVQTDSTRASTRLPAVSSVFEVVVVPLLPFLLAGILKKTD